MDFISNFSKDKIKLITDKKNYRIRYNCVDKLIFKPLEVYSPFGIEKYNKKDILNLELKVNSNEKYNYSLLIKEIDEYFKNLSTTNPDFGNLNYISPIKIQEDGKILIRTHISNKLKIKTNNQTFVLKKNKFKIELEFSSIWIYNENYGLILTVNEIDLT